MMETFVEEYRDGTTIEFVRIERAKDEYSIMTKAEYDRRQAEQSTPIVTADE
jgi:hypothetical protein